MEKTKSAFAFAVLALFALATLSQGAFAAVTSASAQNVVQANNVQLDDAVVAPLLDPPARDNPRIMHVGDAVATERLSVRLSDIGAAQGRNNDHPAIFDILDSNNQVIAQVSVMPRTTYTFTSQDGIALTIRVLATAAGFNQNARWARVNVRELPGNIRHVGETTSSGHLQVRLSEVGAAQGRNNDYPAVLDIIDSNGAVLSQVSAMPGTTYTYRNANLGIVLRIRMYQTTPAFNRWDAWARFGIQEQVLGEILRVGGELRTAHFTARLADVSVVAGDNNAHPAIFDIINQNGDVLGQVSIAEGTQYVFRNGGHRLTIRVYETAPGFNINSKWARADAREQ